MSLFACENCNVIENTSLCGYVINVEQSRRRLLCSECNPAIGQWHGHFARRDADDEGYVPVLDSRYIQAPPA